VKRLLASAAALALLAGCGVQADAAPHAVARRTVPYNLLEQAPSTTAPSAPTPTTAPSVQRVSVLVYFVAGGRLKPVVRDLAQPATVQKAVAALLLGPQEDDIVLGLRSAINPSASAQAKRLDAADFTVDLSPEFAQGPSAEQVLGLAQIVYTVTEIPGVTGVRFTLDGAPIEVPTPSGTLAPSSAPVGREAFADLGPLPPEVQTPS
jgi:spore germination protein GerM